MANNTNNRKNKNPMTAVVIISIIVLVAGIFLLSYISDKVQNNLCMYIGIPILISIVVASIYLTNRIKKMDTVEYKQEAHEYAVKNAFKITGKKDVFVRSQTTTRTIKDD